jgi:hypothetical protein
LKVRTYFQAIERAVSIISLDDIFAAPDRHRAQPRQVLERFRRGHPAVHVRPADREPDIVVRSGPQRPGIHQATGDLSVNERGATVGHRGIEEEAQTPAGVGRRVGRDLLEEIDIETIPASAWREWQASDDGRNAVDIADDIGRRRGIVPAAELIASLLVAKLRQPREFGWNQDTRRTREEHRKHRLLQAEIFRILIERGKLEITKACQIDLPPGSPLADRPIVDVAGDDVTGGRSTKGEILKIT